MVSRLVFIIHFVLLLALNAVSGDVPKDWKKELIQRGQEQIQFVQRNNALNDMRGLSHLNKYIILISPDPEYPNADFITQLKGKRDKSDVGEYMLDASTLNSFNQLLVNYNAESQIKTYLLLIDHIPLDFINVVPDAQTIEDVLKGSRNNGEQFTEEITRRALAEARDIVTGITDQPLLQTQVPMIYCGLVNFKVYENEKTGGQFTVYYPNNSKIDLAEQYRQLLKRYVSLQKDWNGNYKKVSSLITAINLSNGEFGKVKGILPAVETIEDADQMDSLLHTVDANSYSAFTIKQRLHILNVLTSAALLNNREVMALNLLITCPERDYDDLLFGLKTVNPFVEEDAVLVKCLIQKTHDKFLVYGGDNYLKVTQRLTDIVKNSKGFSSRLNKLYGLEGAAFESRVIQWGKSDEKGIRVKSGELLSDGTFAITREQRELISMPVIVGGHTATMATYAYVAMSDPTVLDDPFDLVVFSNHSKLTIANEASEVGQGELALVPAVFLQYTSDKKRNDDLFTAGMILLDGATIMGSGGAALATKVHWLRRAWLLTEVAGAVGNIVINTAALGEDSRFKKLVDGYNIVMAIVGIKNLGQLGLRKLIRNAEPDDYLNLSRERMKEFIVEAYKVEDALNTVKAENAAAGDMLNMRDKLIKVLGLTDDEVAALKSLARQTDDVIDISDDAISLGDNLVVAKSYLTKAARPEGVIDILVHGTANEFKIILNGTEHTLDHRGLANWIKSNGYDKRTIRLLSCSNTASAQDIANKLGQKVVATDDVVRIHADGGISTAKNADWYEVIPGNGTPQIVTKPRPPNNPSEVFVELGGVAKGGTTFEVVVKRLNDLDLSNLKSKVNAFDDAAKGRFVDDIADLSNDALKELDDNFALVDEWKKIDGLDEVARKSSKPEWLRKIQEGNAFNKERSTFYPYNEVYVKKPDGSGYYKLDSYKIDEEIVSRKYTQFGDIQEQTAFSYLNELKSKYPVEAEIANVPTSQQLFAEISKTGKTRRLRGQLILEVPVQNKVVSQSIIDKADELGIVIRDTNGNIY